MLLNEQSQTFLKCKFLWLVKCVHQAIFVFCRRNQVIEIKRELAVRRREFYDFSWSIYTLLDS